MPFFRVKSKQMQWRLKVLPIYNHELRKFVLQLPTTVLMLHSSRFLQWLFFFSAEPQSSCAYTGVSFLSSCLLLPTFPIGLGELRWRRLEGWTERAREKGEDEDTLRMEVCAVPWQVPRPRRLHHPHGWTTWEGQSTVLSLHNVLSCSHLKMQNNLHHHP